MTTINDLIRMSMRKIGVLASGEPLNADEGQDALLCLQMMIDSWNNETLLIPTINVVTKDLINGVTEYTIGNYNGGTAPDNHIETARPKEILSAFLRDKTGTDYIQQIITTKTYSRISRKHNIGRSGYMYVRKSFPLDTILFTSAPYSGDVLHMELVQPLSDILKTASLVEEVNLPTGYQRAIVYNLCLDLADEWGRQISPSVATIATESKKLIKRNNYRTLTLGIDRSLVGRRTGLGTFDIRSGI